VSSYKASHRAPAPAAAVGSVIPAAKVEGSPVSMDVPAPAGAAPARPPYQAPRLVRGQIYSYIQDGVRHYTSKAPRGLGRAVSVRTIKYSFMETCYACGAKPGVNFGTLRLNSVAYQAEIRAAARDYGVDEAIVRAIIHAESAFNPNALSRVGAQGLMQLTPLTSRALGVTDPTNPRQSVAAGCRYLRQLLDRFNGNLALALAAYNAGPTVVARMRRIPPFPETRRYVATVSNRFARFRADRSV